MKKSLMLVGAMMISTFIFAQRESMKDVLALNDAQEASIKEINKKFGQRQEDLQKERQAEIAKVLTPEQNSNWKAYKKGLKDGRRKDGHRMHHRRGR